jgi:L-asparaginase II
MSHLFVEVLRSGLVESTHRISAAIVDGSGRLLAASGDPQLVTYWRSAAKPFQALPLVEDGVLEHFGLGTEDLALACASHSSEPHHLAVTDRILRQAGCTEADLACGPHPPLGVQVAREVASLGVQLTPRWSNCSGKHAGMLALARYHGWDAAGYERAGHPVQDRIFEAVTQVTGVERGAMVLGVDGCTTVCYGLPVIAMARAYAALANDGREALGTVRRAMLAHPEMIAGEGRFCTDLMRALPGEIIAKVGAEGIHCAALPRSGMGIALKVEDGDMRASPPALLAILQALAPRLPPEARLPLDSVPQWSHQSICNTRGVQVGEIRASGAPHFLDLDLR